MSEFSIPPPPPPQNPFGEMEELQIEMAEALHDLFAEQAAMRGVLTALASTHPEPKLLADAYLTHMDSIAEQVRPARIERYRTAAQQWMDLLLDCVNRQTPP